MSELVNKTCRACEGDASALTGARVQELLTELGNGWRVVQEHHLEKEFDFKDFRQALDFTNVAGETAEKEQHHPDIFLSWGKVRVTIWTHKVDGLTKSDFILAAKIEAARPQNS